MGYCNLLAEDVGDNPLIKEEVEGIMSASRRAVNLTKQLLAFSRKQAVEPRIIDVNDFLRDLEKMIRRLVSENINLKFYLEAKRATISIDPGQFEQIIINLVVNAIRYSRSGEVVSVAAASSAGEAGSAGGDCGQGYRLRHCPEAPAAAVRALLSQRPGKEQVVDNRVQPLGLAQHRLQERDRDVPVIDGPSEQGLDIAADRGDRRPQLVRDVGDEVPADSLQPPQLGDVVDHRQRPDFLRPAGMKADDADLQQLFPFPVTKDDLVLHRFAGGQYPADLVLQLDVADHGLQKLSGCLPGIDPEQAGGGGNWMPITRSSLSIATTASIMLEKRHRAVSCGFRWS